MENLTGKHLGPYEITAPIGEGGMASVYQAYEESNRRYVALKVLPKHIAESRQFAARFQQEAHVIAQLRHPNILPVYDAGEDEGYTYIAMPLVTGGTLMRLLRGRPLPPRQTLRVLSQVGSALDYAHSMGFIHRDVKPSNVLLDEDGNCLLMDFGLAKVLASSAQLTRSGSTLGTPMYMSPEQGRGEKVDGRSDLYALGVMLYQMATGRVPFDGDTPINIIFKHIREPLPPPSALNPAIPAAVEQVIFKATAKDPNERYQSAAEMVQALRSALGANRPPPQPQPEPRPRAPRAPRVPPPPEPAPLPPEKRLRPGQAPTVRGFHPGDAQRAPISPLEPPRAGLLSGVPPWLIVAAAAALVLVLCLATVLIVSWGKLLGL
jgi:serine/threonine-protein kinase